MATTIFKASYDMRGISNKLGSLKEAQKKTSEDVQKLGLLEARYLGNQIVKGYTKYLSENSYLSDLDDDQRITVIVNERKDGGYNINLRGKNVLYYEYGTGTRGLENYHEKKPKNMTGYGEGRDIIHNAKRNNKHELPRWYPFNEDGSPKKPNMLLYMASADKDLGSVMNIRLSDYVWKHNGIVTKGAPAGKFIYNAVNDYRNYFNRSDDKMRLSSRSVSIRLKARIHDIMKK